MWVTYLYYLCFNVKGEFLKPDEKLIVTVKIAIKYNV